MHFVRGRFFIIFLFSLLFNVILIEHLKRDRFCRRARIKQREASSPLESLVLLGFPRLRRDSVRFVEHRTAGCSQRSDLHTIEKQRILIEQSNLHDRLHGVDIECTAAGRVGRILEVFFGWRHPGGSHVVPNFFHLKRINIVNILKKKKS